MFILPMLISVQKTKKIFLLILRCSKLEIIFLINYKLIFNSFWNWNNMILYDPYKCIDFGDSFYNTHCMNPNRIPIVGFQRSQNTVNKKYSVCRSAETGDTRAASGFVFYVSAHIGNGFSITDYSNQRSRKYDKNWRICIF